MAGAGALHVSRAAKDTYNRCGTWDSRHFHPATAILPTRLGQRRTRSRLRLSCGRQQDATMKATLHERDADHDELLRRVQVQPDDVADQQRPRRWSSYGASGTCPAYSRISLRTWAFTG